MLAMKKEKITMKPFFIHRLEIRLTWIYMLLTREKGMLSITVLFHH
jgi:hypothetical protein